MRKLLLLFAFMFCSFSVVRADWEGGPTVVYSTGPIGVTLSGSSSVSLTGTSTVTFNGIGQPVTSTSTLVDNLANDSLAVHSTTTFNASVTGSTVGIVDAGGSITVDNAGTFAVQAAQSGAWSVTGSTIGVMDSGGSLTVDATSTTFTVSSIVQASIDGGATYYMNVDLGTTGVQVKATGGTIYTITAGNVNADERFLKLYDLSSFTVGTSTPAFTFIIPGNANGAGTNIPIPACGVKFVNGIGVGATTGAAVGNTGAPTAGDVSVNLILK